MITLSRGEARKRLVAHLALNAPLRNATAVLDRLRAIQLDPLDVIGTNADLVLMARVPSARRGDVYRDLFPKHAFEHFFKERCILPASSFPQYRERAHLAQTRWWRHDERVQKIPAKLVEAVLEEVRERGPVSAKELTDHGSVVPIDWAGWSGTSKTTSMALEILWTRCEVVVAGRNQAGAKLYDVPERSFGRLAREKAREDFESWLLRERAHAYGLLAWPRAKSAPEGLLEVTIEGSSRRYLAVPEFFAKRSIRFDDRPRILGPLDPMLWDRNLVGHIFEFEYVWEVYKPEKLRKWGWYVCPILFRDRLIARVDATNPRKVWLEDGADRAVVREAVREHRERL